MARFEFPCAVLQHASGAMIAAASTSVLGPMLSKALTGICASAADCQRTSQRRLQTPGELSLRQAPYSTTHKSARRIVALGIPRQEPEQEGNSVGHGHMHVLTGACLAAHMRAK